jgi:sulfoxide reductase heme-binding subunit YedZ
VTTSPAPESSFGGPKITVLCAGVIGAMCLAGFVSLGPGEEAVRLGLRITARTTAALLVVIMIASPVARLWPGGTTRWLLANRRWLGLSLAASHLGFHLPCVLALYAMGAGGDTGLVTVVGGGIGFALIAAMAITSTDAAQRRLGANWRRLHLVSLYAVWLIYAFSYVPTAGQSVVAAAFSVALALAMVLRFWPAPR